MTQEKLSDIYLELLQWLRYEGKPSVCIWHPLFYTYPWGLRFELGDPLRNEREDYIRSATERGERIWQEAFTPTDEVLVIFDTTPEKELKRELKHCQAQRVRTKCMPAFPDDDEAYEERFFHRYLYAASAREIPFDLILSKIVEGEMLAETKVYSSAVYFYNRTKKLLFHPYDDRGADLIGPDRETLRPYYEGLNDLLLNWNREDIDRKWKCRRVHLRILTTTTDPERVRVIREKLKKKLRGTELTLHSFEPYWKIEGWGELCMTFDSARPLKDIQYRLASKWECDTASPEIRAEIFLPDVGFLWVGE